MKGRHECGFSLIELLPAIVLTMAVVGALVGLAGPGIGTAMKEPDALDVQQRLRATAELIARDLRQAGAGVDTGPMTGSLHHYISAIYPRRLGLRNADEPDVARGDVITVLTVPAASPQSTLASEMSAMTIVPRDGSGCVAGQPACGFNTGMDVVLFDALGRFNLLSVTDRHEASVAVRLHATGVPLPFAAGALVARVEARTYYLDRASAQLRRYNTGTTDVPVVDGIADFQVAYFGSPAPPSRPRPGAGEANCLYDSAGNPRDLPALPADSDGLAALPMSVLRDGPWCGEGVTRFDADLYRVRRLSITIASVVGQRVSSNRSVRLTVDVAPRNLRGGL